MLKITGIYRPERLRDLEPFDLFRFTDDGEEFIYLGHGKYHSPDKFVISSVPMSQQDETVQRTAHLSVKDGRIQRKDRSDTTVSLKSLKPGDLFSFQPGTLGGVPRLYLGPYRFLRFATENQPAELVDLSDPTMPVYYLGRLAWDAPRKEQS